MLFFVCLFCFFERAIQWFIWGYFILLISLLSSLICSTKPILNFSHKAYKFSCYILAGRIIVKVLLFLIYVIDFNKPSKGVSLFLHLKLVLNVNSEHSNAHCWLQKKRNGALSCCMHFLNISTSHPFFSSSSSSQNQFPLSDSLRWWEVHH